MMSPLTMSLGDRFCVSRKGRTRRGGWVHPKGATTWPCPSWAGFSKALVNSTAKVFHGLDGRLLTKSTDY